MISYVKGIVDSVTLSSVIVDNNGIGYELLVTPGTLSKMRTGEEVKIHTYFQVREDSMTLFGFLDKEELKMFTMLISVSGIGPKSAINMLSQAGPRDLMLAIISDDIAAMSKFPGIGKKTAGRLILELKDKIKSQDAAGYDFTKSADSSAAGLADSPKANAVSALTALGYMRSEAVKAVASIADDSLDIQQLIKLALKLLSSL